jgi:integrase
MKLTLRDIEGLERALTSGRLANYFTGKPLAHSSQVDLRILLKIFLRWRLGSAKAETLTGWLDTHPRPKTPDYLKEAEVERLYRDCRNAEQRFLIAVLFDSGARAEEFHNIRFEDIYLPENKESFVRIALKQEYSKTLGRTIALYWKYSLEAAKEYLAERIAEGIKPSEPVFRGNYDATRKSLGRLGYRILKRPIHYHLFRHSSATYYATKLNRQELCYRLGWRFSSGMADTYVARSGMETKALDEKFAQTDLSALKDELVKIQQAGLIKEDRIQHLQERVEVLQHNLEMVSRVLNLKIDPVEVAAALERRQPKLEPGAELKSDGGRG